MYLQSFVVTYGTSSRYTAFQTGCLNPKLKHLYTPDEVLSIAKVISNWIIINFRFKSRFI